MSPHTHLPIRRTALLLMTAASLMLGACRSAQVPAETPAPAAQPTLTATVALTASTAATATTASTAAATTAAPAAVATVTATTSTASGANGASGAASAPTGKRTTTIDALWFSKDPDTGTAIGGISPTTVTINKDPEGKFRLGIFENEVGGTGDMWRATAWTATIVAALLTNTDLSKSEVSWDVAGRIDGPSAGGLMTVAVLGTLRGHKVRDDASMTGTINPDGTIGPVGGIPHKIEGAAKKGKKLILIPSGQRYDMDVNKKQEVDLVELGRTLDVQVKEVSDIYQAYTLLTGDELPKLSTSNTRPEVTTQIFNRMQAKTREWQARYSDTLGRTATINKRIKDLLDKSLPLTTADGYFQKSESFISQGLPAAAYNSARRAALYAGVYERAARLIDIELAQGFDAAAAVLQSEAVGTKVSAAADLLKADTPANVSDTNTLIIGYSNLAQGLAAWLTGQNILARAIQIRKDPKATKMKLADELTVILYTALYYEAANTAVETAKDSIAVGADQPGSKLAADLPLEDTADFFRRSAEANFALFESTVIGPDIAQPRGMSLDAAKSALRARDLEYGLGQGALDAINLLDTYFKDPKALQYAKLGAAMQAYGVSNSMIAKYYSLGAKLDNSLNVVGYSNDKALLNMLDLADEQARYSINVLGQNGDDVSMFAIGYESARIGREGTPADKLSALGDYWGTYILSRAVAYLAGVGVAR